MLKKLPCRHVYGDDDKRGMLPSPGVAGRGFSAGGIRDKMKPELEQIVSCDENARAVVLSAEKEADRIVQDARKEAEEIESELETRLEKTRKDEIEPMIRDAMARAEKIEADAGSYMEKLRSGVETHRKEIMDKFLAGVLAGPSTSVL